MANEVYNGYGSGGTDLEPASAQLAGAFAPPGFIGPYRLLGELGHGAMARVWRAFDSNLQREVAIKEPLFQTVDENGDLNEMGRRFIAEGRAAARLNHPNIITIHAADVYDGRPVIVMELIDGTTLGSLLAGGPLAPSDVVYVLDQLLDAVGYAHAQGIVHRDIKPENIFINSNNQVKLADFGIARIEDAAAGHGTRMGAILGTPGYMSPEQATGSPVDARSDLFSIGTLAYEMLTGVNPFGAGSGADSTTVMYRIVHEPVEPLPPSASAGTSADIRPAIMAALQKSPEARPQSAAHFKSMLHGTTPTMRWARQPDTPASKTLLPFVAVAAVLAIVLIGVFMSASQGGGGGGGGTAPSSLAPTTSENNGGSGNANAASGVWLGVDGDYVAVYTEGRDTPYRTTTIPISVLEPETAAQIGAGVACNSLEDALARVKTFEEEYAKLSEQETSEADQAADTSSAGATPPAFTQQSASSVAASENTDTHSPNMTVDGNAQTAWVADGSAGTDGSAWIELNADALQHVSGIRILPGFCKSEETWGKTQRPHNISLSFSDGTIGTVELPDVFGQYFEVGLEAPVDTTYVRITIDSTYNASLEGSTYDGCAISEIEVY